VICLAPRAPGDSVRPRGLSGVVVRPLNFTVRGPPQVHAALKVLSACVLCGLTACEKTPEETRAALLDKLRGCLKEVSITKSSPCTKLELRALDGIARADLLASLGPPTFCTLPPIVPKEPDCPAHHNMWSFYKLPPHSVGGGPELTCDSDQTGHCTVVRWGHSE
jgi:hypothetical protein